MVPESLILRAVGLAVIHFSWQGLLAGGVLAGALKILRGPFPELRYLLCLVTMVAMLVTPVVTVGIILADLPAPPAHSWLHLPVLGMDTSLAAVSSPLLPWIAWLWLVGASVLHLRMLTSWLWIRALQRTASTRVPECWKTEMRMLRARMKISRPVGIAESALVRVPSVVGWFRPIVLLPLDVATRLTTDQLRGILAHELAHIRRHDLLVNVLQCTFESLLFFHPVTWWVSRRLRTEREYCCDDIALAVTDEPIAYARALARLDEIRNREAGPALSSTGGNLMRRITRIFENDHAGRVPAHRWLPAAMAAVGLFAVLAITGTGCLSEPATTAEAMVGPAPAPAAADQETLVAMVTAKIEAARESGAIAPAMADRILEQITAGNVVFSKDSCCGSSGVMATIECPAGSETEAGDACCPGGPPADCSAKCVIQVVGADESDSI